MSICPVHKISEDSATWQRLNEKAGKVWQPYLNLSSPCPLCVLSMMAREPNPIIADAAKDVLDSYEKLWQAQERFAKVGGRDTFNVRVEDDFGKGAIEHLELEDPRSPAPSDPHEDQDDLPF